MFYICKLLKIRLIVKKFTQSSSILNIIDNLLFSDKQKTKQYTEVIYKTTIYRAIYSFCLIIVVIILSNCSSNVPVLVLYPNRQYKTLSNTLPITINSDITDPATNQRTDQNIVDQTENNASVQLKFTQAENTLQMPKINHSKATKQLNLLPVEAFEALKSANVPMLNHAGKLHTNKQYIWLRPPAKLIDEYMRMRLIESGIRLIEEGKPALKIVLAHCYIDENLKTSNIKLDVYLDNDFVFSLTNSSSARDLVPLMLSLLEQLIEQIKVQMQTIKHHGQEQR